MFSAVSTPDLIESEVHILNAKKVVIAGAGPIGLIEAILLHKRGIKNITLIDSWMGECIRAHEVRSWTLEKIQEIIAPYEILNDSADPESIQFKDMEKQLYKIVESLGIVLIKKQFHSFSTSKKVVIIDKTASSEGEKEELTNVDIFIDCTGAARAGLTNYNTQQLLRSGSLLFTIKPLTSTQTPRLFAKMRLIGDLIAFNKFNEPSYLVNLENYFKIKEELNRVGWKEGQPPPTYTMTRPKKGSSLTKGHAYMELPKEYLDTYLKDKKSIPEKDLLNYAKILFKLTNNTTEEIKFEVQKSKNPHKKMVSTFITNPHQTTPPFILEDKNYPFIMHLGDASASLPFQTGQSLSFGVSALVEILSCFEIEDGIIKKIQIKKWQNFYKSHLGSIQQRVNELGEKIKKRNIDIATDLKAMCYQAYIQSDNKTIQDLAVGEYRKLDPNVDLLSIAIQKTLLGIIKKPIEEKNIIYPSITKQALDKDTDNLEKFCKLHAEDFSKIKQIGVTWSILAISYKNIGNSFIHNNKTKLAIVCYQKSLKIYDNYLSGLLNEKIILYSNLIVALFKIQDYQTILDTCNKASALFKSLEKNSKNNQIINKILFYKVKALLDKGNKTLEDKPLKKEKIDKILDEINSIIADLPSNKNTHMLSKDHSALEKKLNHIISSAKFLRNEPTRGTTKSKIVNSSTLYQPSYSRNGEPFAFSYTHPLLDREEDFNANRC